MLGTGFFDLHCHTFFSDGTLVPSELIQRTKKVGCRCLAFTDHVDHSNVEFVLGRLLKFIDEVKDEAGIGLIPGVEITHVTPSKIGELIIRSRALGAQWVVVHGETIVEPVAPGTNRAAIEGGADLLSHPGLITEEDTLVAANLGVHLEITTRVGHSLCNGWVAKSAIKYGAKLLLNSDTHSSTDIIDLERRENIALGAGLNKIEILKIWENAKIATNKKLM